MVLAGSNWLWPVQDSCSCFWIVVAGCIWCLMVLYGFSWLWPVADCSQARSQKVW